MKRITHTKRSKHSLLHIETDFGIVNIRVGLSDVNGHPVESVEILADDGVVLDGHVNNRLIGKLKEVK